MAKKERPIVKKEVKIYAADPNNTDLNALKQTEEKSPVQSDLVKSILNALQDTDDKIQRLGFERDPTQNNEFAAIYRQKIRLIPDTILKRIAIQDDLVAAIVNARSNHISAFGRPRPDRFSLGFAVDIKAEIIERASAEQKEELYKRISAFEKRFLDCGSTEGYSSQERLTLPRFLAMQTRNAMVVGRFATEFVWTINKQGDKEFHSFRPIDGGTIYRAAPYKGQAEQVRKMAKRLMEQMLNKKFKEEQLDNLDQEYPWVQVIEGKPVQAFTSKELYVHNCYPVTDVELQGYPLTPLDTVIAAVTTHINITSHNKLFFQSGRAAKGMLVIQSEDLDPSSVDRIRQQFQANINNVNNSWRMPVFSIGKDDTVNFQTMESSARDMEFQYLSDTNARVILSAFQMSPEELPGYAHLSRGTNNQALSESNKEYQLEAHRDTGIRPLLAHFEDFFNQVVFPTMDDELSKFCTIKLVGLDADTAEKEAVRISTDAQLHMNYDEILGKVEKDPIGKEWGGEFSLNPAFQAVLDKYIPVGQIVEKFFGRKGASKDPNLQYLRDPFYFQWLQLQMQMQQMQMQQEQMQMEAQQQAAGGAPQGGDAGGAPPEGGGEAPQEGQEQPQQGQQPQEGQQEEGQQTQKNQGELSTGIDQLLATLGKSEAQLPPSKRRLLAQQKKMIKGIMDDFEADAKKAMDEILDIGDKFAPKK